MALARVAFLLLPGAQLLDFAGPAEVFGAVGALPGAADRPGRGYDLAVLGPCAETRTATGVTVRAAPLASLRGSIDTLVVPGGIDFPSRDFPPAALRWLERAAPRARRVASVCTGAFVLAKVGLLDGRRVTSHWSSLEALARAAPRASVERDALYVKDGPIYTSAGVSAGLDLALALVEEDHGHGVALEVARALVMFLHRPGGQSQFSAALTSAVPRHDGVRAARTRVLSDPAGDHRVPALARVAAMSTRHFVRVFTAETGEPPARFVQRVRLERARQELERTQASLDEIAAGCGFGTVETLRRAFQRALGVSPSAYRARFARGESERAARPTAARRSGRERR